MILLILLLLGSPSAFAYPSSTDLSDHFADALKVKCDALLYRSWKIDRTCYFAIIKQQTLSQSRFACYYALKGAELIQPQETVLKKLFLEVADFHHPAFSSSEEKKYALCTYEIPQSCSSGQLSSLHGGKCVIRAPQKMTYPNAVNYCASQSSELPVLKNSREKSALSGYVRSEPIWLGVSVNNTHWSNNNQYAWHTTCKDGNIIPPRDRQSFCGSNFAEILNPQGHTSVSEQSNLMDVFCVRDASSELWTPKEVIQTTSTSTTTTTKTTTTTTTTTPAPLKYSPTCPPSELWSEWEVISKEPCRTTCGSCTMVPRKRTCLKVCGNCKCTGPETDVGPCGTNLCPFPTPTCCGNYRKSINYRTKTFFCGESDVPTLQACVVTNPQKLMPAVIPKTTTTQCTNLNDQFDDPCVKEFVPVQIQAPICPQDRNKLYVIRKAGYWYKYNRTIETFGIDKRGWFKKKYTDFWSYKFKSEDIIRAEYNYFYCAVCATVDPAKCPPCSPLPRTNVTLRSYAPVPERDNPCASRTSKLYYNNAPQHGNYAIRNLDSSDTTRAILSCKAGVWMLWSESQKHGFPVTSAACVN